MTFGEMRAAVRDLRATRRRVRDAVERWEGRVDSIEVLVDPEVFDRCEWALGRVKVWDEEQRQWIRINQRYVLPQSMRTQPHCYLGGAVIVRAGVTHE
jgi:hypothetical protein